MRLRKVHVIAVKSAVWQVRSDVIYGADRWWWFQQAGMPGVAAFKISASPSVVREWPAVRQVVVDHSQSLPCDRAGVVGGEFSGLHAINLAIGFGARRIVLVGFDLIETGMRSSMVIAWRRELEACAPTLRSMGVELINSSARSALGVYRKAALAEVI